MIKINLTPVEELENQNWWWPDAIGLAFIVLLSVLSGYYYLYTLETQVEEYRQEAVAFEQKYRNLKGDIDKYEELSESIVLLQSKKESLTKITDSKVLRYLPIILIENLQNLKLEGIWFNQVKIISLKDNSTTVDKKEPTASNIDTSKSIKVEASRSSKIWIELDGTALNNSLVAEFMTALQDTIDQDVDPDDLRTQVAFDEVSIAHASSKKISQDDESEVDVVGFRLTFGFQDLSDKTELENLEKVSLFNTKKERF